MDYEKIAREVASILVGINKPVDLQPFRKEYITSLVEDSKKFSCEDLATIYDKVKKTDRRYTYTPSFLEYLKYHD